LITITIISILAALVLGVAAVAAEKARENHSRHVVTRLHTLLTQFYDSFKTRRVRLDQDVLQAIQDADFRNNFDRGRALAEARLYALREIMLLEIPDRWSDVLLQDIGTGQVPIFSAKEPLYLNERTDLANVYLRRYRRLIGHKNSISGEDNTPGDIRLNQGAECLYMVITLATGDGEARSQFAEKSIGDTDGDGAPEFLDGWGNPIEFLRWAPGFDSQIELSLPALDLMTPSEADAAVANDHDPFDVFRAEADAFRLVPLIYSAGRDEEYGIYDASLYVAWLHTSPAPTVNTNQPPYVEPQLTPYVKPASLPYYLGVSNGLIDPSLSDTATDNVHNHLLGLK
jgi:hypothetical protein